MKVFIETSEGTLYNLDGLATEISLTQHMDLIDVSSYANPGAVISGRESIEFEIRGVADGAMTFGDVKAAKTAAEWKCLFCGRPNKRERETCASCGAVRSFLYG